MTKRATALLRLTFTLLLTIASYGWAQPPPPPSPCDTAGHHAFDFWIGSWDVRTADGTLAGNNAITREHGGCLIEERWTGAGGGGGSSMNYFDPVVGAWHQLWVSGNTLIEIAGGLDGDDMALSGEITYFGGGDRVPFRGRWSPLEDGRVRQHFEEYRDGRWQTWFEGFYTRSN